MWGEPFSCVMMCSKCEEKLPHLIELDSIHFKEKIILFWATCSECNRISFLTKGEPCDKHLFKCDYQYFEDISPLEDLPCDN